MGREQACSLPALRMRGRCSGATQRARRLFLESLESRQLLAAALYAVPVGQGNFIVELNPTTGAEIRRFNTPVNVANGADALAFNGESLFFLSGTSQLFELNPTTGAVLDSDSLTGLGSGGFDGLGYLSGKLYIQDYNLGRAHIFDPLTDTVQGALVIAGGAIGGLTGASGPDELIATLGSTAKRINPETGAVTGTFSLPNTDYLGVATLNNQLYFSRGSTNEIRVTDRAGTLVNTLSTPYPVSALASDDTRIERVTNGGFEQNLAGWTVFNQPGSGGNGFAPYSGPNPFTSTLPAPPAGNLAVANQHTGQGTYILYRDLVLPSGQSHVLTLQAYYENRFTAFVTPNTLDYQTGSNQQFRIDVIRPTADLLSLSATDVLQNVFRTNVGDPLTRAPGLVSSDLTGFAGQTVRLRIAVTNNQNFLFAGVDAVSLLSNTMPTTPPPSSTRIYVAQTPVAGGAGGRVEVFDENLTFLSTIDDPIFDTGVVNDVEVGPTGDVFVAIEVGPTLSGKIARFTPTGTFVNSITLPNVTGQPLSLLGFDVADDGTFWVAHPNRSNRAFHISATGAFLGESVVTSSQPYDVSVSTAGQLFASDGQLGQAFNSLRSDGNRWQARFSGGDAQLLSPTNALLATRSVGGQVIDAQESNAGNLYLTQFGTTASVRRFDATGAPNGNANTTERATGIAVSTTTVAPPPVGTRIYVAEQALNSNPGGRVEVYDENLLLQFTIDDPVFDTGLLNDVELGPTGDVFVAMEIPATGQGRIIRFTATGTFVSATTMPVDMVGQPIRMLGFDVADDGTFWLAHPNRSGKVFHVSASGTLLGESTVAATQPLDVSVTSGGTLYVSTGATGETFNSLRADGNRWQARQSAGDALLLSPTNAVLATRAPGGSVIDVQEADSGNLFLTRYDTVNSLLKFTAAGTSAGMISTPERAVGIAVSTANTPPPPSGTRIYVAEREPDGIGGRVEAFDESLALVQTIDHAVFDTGTLSDIEIGPNGNLFIGIDTTSGPGITSGAGGQLLEFTPAGAFVRTINLPTDSNGPNFFPLGFTVAPDGSFRVAAPNTPNLVFHVSQSGTLLASLFTSTNSPADVAIDASLNLYTSSVAAGETGINMRADGSFWVSRHLQNLIDLRSPGGPVLAQRSFGTQPVDSQESASGDLYSVRFGTSAALRKFDAAGNVINTVNLTEAGSGIAIASAAPSTFQVSNFTATSTGVRLDFNHDLDASGLHIYDVEGSPLGIPDFVLQGATVGNVRGSLIVDPGLRRVTFVSTAGPLPPDIYTLTVRSATDGFRNSAQALLDGDGNGTAGGNYVRNFTVSIPPGAVAISVPNFARGPQQQVNVPAPSTLGLPLSFSNGDGINAATFEIRYNPALLTIQSAAVSPGLPAGAGVTLNTSTPGVAIVQFASPTTPLPAGARNFVQLSAIVPAGATYRSKHVLDIASIVINGGAIAGIDDDGVHLVAYFGDATGNGTYGSSDAARIARLATALEGGLAAYKLLDPLIVADISGNSLFSSTDTSRILQAVVGLTVADIPPLPSPAASIVQGGPDPKLWLPTNLVARPGEDLAIPLNIDSIVNLTGNGLDAADLILFYDPAVLDVHSVSLGSLLGGADSQWLLAANVDPLAGKIIISLAGTQPLEGLFVGELVSINATVKSAAAPGASALNLAASTREPSRFTQLNDGYLTLIPAPTDAANDPIDGLLTVLPPAVTAPPARVVGNQLVVAGTSAADQIFVALVDDELVRVRIGAQVVGTFPRADVQGIAVDGLGGSDHIVVAPGIAAAVVATQSAGVNSDDLVFGGGDLLHASSAASLPMPSLGGSAPPTDPIAAREAALLQLLATWANEAESPIGTAAGRPLRWRRW